MFDSQLSVTVPGGLPLNSRLERVVTFKPINGVLEQAISSIDKNGNLPERVTNILNLALDKIGDLNMTRELASQLCVADRQFLMLQLAVMFEGDHMWLHVECEKCDKTFDVDLKRSELPIKSAGRNYPSTVTNIKGKDVSFRSLTGFDQEKLSKEPQADLLKQALYYCSSFADGSPMSMPFIDQLSADEIESIDTLLDEIAPAICEELQVVCPECRHEQTASIDHYQISGVEPISFYSEVHQLASHYHWSEDEILQLPRGKRKLYLKLISQSQGMME